MTDEEIVAAYRSGEPIARIATALGTTPYYVRRSLVQSGETIGKRGGGKKAVRDRSKEDALVRAYRELGSLRAVAKRFNVAYQWVSFVVNRYKREKDSSL